MASLCKAGWTGNDRSRRTRFDWQQTSEDIRGGLNESVVLVEFDSLDKALAVYETPAYKEALKVKAGEEPAADRRVYPHHQ